MKTRIVRGLLLNSIGLILGLSIDLVMARVLSVENFATWRILFSYILILSLVMSLGKLNYLVQLSANKFKQSVLEFDKTVVAILLMLTIFLVASLFVNYVFSFIDISLILLSFFLLLSRTIFILSRSILIGSGREIMSQITDRLLTNLMPLVLIGVVYYYDGINLNLQSLLIIYLMTFIFLSITVYLSLDKQIYKSIKVYTYTDLHKVVVSNINNLKVETLDTIFRLIPIIISPVFLSPLEIALLAIIVRIADSGTFIQTTFNNIYLKVISVQFNTTNRISFFHLYLYVVVCGVFGIALIFSLLFIAPYIVNLIGEEYIDLIDVIVYSGVATILRITSGPTLFFTVLLKKQTLVSHILLVLLILYILVFSISTYFSFEASIITFMIFFGFSNWVITLWILIKQ